MVRVNNTHFSERQMLGTTLVTSLCLNWLVYIIILHIMLQWMRPFRTLNGTRHMILYPIKITDHMLTIILAWAQNFAVQYMLSRPGSICCVLYVVSPGWHLREPPEVVLVEGSQHAKHCLISGKYQIIRRECDKSGIIHLYTVIVLNLVSVSQPLSVKLTELSLPLPLK